MRCRWRVTVCLAGWLVAQMPPSGPLAKSEVAALVKWIQQGAHWPQAGGEVRLAPKSSGFKITPEDRAFWAFQPLANPPVPKVSDSVWPKTSLDYFILAKL